MGTRKMAISLSSIKYCYVLSMQECSTLVESYIWHTPFFQWFHINNNVAINHMHIVYWNIVIETNPSKKAPRWPKIGGKYILIFFPIISNTNTFLQYSNLLMCILFIGSLLFMWNRYFKNAISADRIRSHDLTHWVKSNSALNHSATTTTYTTSELHCTYIVNVE